MTAHIKQTWFTADTHLDHQNSDGTGIIKYANRPFKDINHMNETIVFNWNMAVHPEDEIWFLGDFSFSDHDPWLARLNGIKHLVWGNHDHEKRRKKATLWSSMQLAKRITINGQHIWLMHYKMATWGKSHRGALHLYGHSHGNWPGDSQCCDVGVDCWNFRPITLSQAVKRMNTQPKRIEVDHHSPQLPKDHNEEH